jgi:excisionase family DNA binding protein
METRMERVYTVPEVAEYLKISRSKMYYLVQRGSVPHIRIGRNLRITESQLIEWLKEKTVKSNDTYPAYPLISS